MKKWLAANEIYFKTLASLILSISAIVISILQFTNTALQRTIAEAQAMPQFDIAIHKKNTGSDNFYDTAYLTVINNGGPVSQFNAKVIYFLKSEIATKENQFTLHKIQFPVNGYFATQLLSSNSRGELTTYFQYDNCRKIHSLVMNMMQSAQDRGLIFVSTDEVVYISLYYTDLLQREHVEYYKVNFIGSAERLQSEEGEQIFTEYTKSTPRELSSLNANDIINELLNNQRNNN